MELDYVVETTPMGTGGGIRLGLGKCTDEFALVLNGDSFFDVNLHDFFRLHTNETSQFSLSLRKVNDSSRYGTIETDANNRIISFKEKTDIPGEGKINGGVYILNRELYLKATPPGANFSIEKDFFEKHLSSLVIKGFEFNGYFIDIGIPEDYSRAQHDLKGFTYR